MGKDEAITQRHDPHSKRLPRTRDAKSELDIELDERIPQTLPRQTFRNQILIRLAMEGQPADFANMAMKKVTEKKNTSDIMPNNPIASMQK